MGCTTHTGHDHYHGPNCGHVAVRHDDHTDYLHGGHLHHSHENHVDEHVIAVTKENPATCTPGTICGGHKHGGDCGHEQVPHGDHVDYLVDDRLHHPHGEHCDIHGALAIAAKAR